MKKYFLMIMIASGSFLLSCMEEGVRIKGTIEGGTDNEEVRISILTKNPLTTDTCHITPTSEGSFDKILPIKEERELYLMVNEEYITRFLAEKGDIVELSWESNNPFGTFKFTDPARSREQELSELLKLRFAKEINTLYKLAPQGMNQPYDSTLLDKIAEYINAYRQAIEDFEQTHGTLPHKSAFLVKGYFEAMNTVLYSHEAMEELKLRGIRSGLPEDTVKGKAAYEVLPAHYLVHQPYRSFLWEWSHLQAKRLTGPADSLTTLYDKYIERLETTFDIIHDHPTAEWALAYRAQFAEFDLPPNEAILYLHHLEKRLAFPWAKTYVQQVLNKLTPFQSGKDAPDFQLVDESGKSYTLKDFREKYLYMGFWSKSCGVCHREFKQIPALRQKYQAYDDQLAYAFVYIGTDENEQWTKYIDRHGSRQGINLRPATNEKNVYDIIGFPTYILISPNGKIVEYATARPSELLKETENLLDKELKGYRREQE